METSKLEQLGWSQHYAICLCVALLTVGCSSLDDDEWVVRPGEASDSIAIEQASGDMVCVRDPATNVRTCVPEVSGNGRGSLE